MTPTRRLIHARAALREAATLLRDCATLGGGLTEDTRAILRLTARELDGEADWVDSNLLVRVTRDMDDARQRRRGAA